MRDRKPSTEKREPDTRHEKNFVNSYLKVRSGSSMEPFLISILAAAVAEIGDRSMFLAILLGVQYRRPWPVFWGMTAGLFANQAISALVGVWIFRVISPDWQAWLVGSIFVIMAIWVLIPEKEPQASCRSWSSIFWAAALGFFILEMADKTQLAVITLAGAMESYLPVVAGATLGILMVTTPALWLGHRFASLLPMKYIRIMASGVFLLIGAWILIGTI